MNISPSSYNSWHTCNRLYYFEHVLRVERVKQDGARRLGTMLHAGLEAWWSIAGDDRPWADVDEALVAARAAIADNAKHIETDPVEVAKARAMMTVYHARYAGELVFESTSPHGPGVEVWYNLPLLDRHGTEFAGWRHVGKKDALKRFPDGRVRVVEHKNTSAEIHGASDYWQRLAIDTQITMYIDAAQLTLDRACNEAWYDVIRRPALRRFLETPVDKREYTKGKGCKECGGSAGGKRGVQQGSGKIRTQKLDAGKVVDVTDACHFCNGTGWKLDDDGEPDKPRLIKNHRDRDEPIEDFERRIIEEMTSDPDKYMRQGRIRRTPEDVAAMRDDLIATTGVIGAMVTMARQSTNGQMHQPEAAACFSRNTQTCTDVYGRRCDFFDVCTGQVDMWNSPLYQLKKRKSKPEAPAQGELVFAKGDEP
jgi:hypothetical protein